jgi:hypothetical protein
VGIDEVVRVRPDRGRDDEASDRKYVLAATVAFAAALRNGEKSDRSSRRALSCRSCLRAPPGLRSS